MSALAALPYVLQGADALSGIQAAGAQASGLRAQGAYARRIGEINAGYADVAARDVMDQAREAKGEVLSRTRRLIGSQRAALAAQGLDVASGTALDIQRESEVMGELDALTVVNNATREAFGYKVQAFRATAEGRLAELSGRNEASALQGRATQTALTRGLEAYTGWLRTRQPRSG